MNKKKENKKVPCKKHSRKISAEVKKIYQNILKDNLDLLDDSKVERNICKCVKTIILFLLIF